MRHLSLVVCFLFLFAACEQSPKTNFKPLNLLPQGVPVTILAPESPEIKMKDMTVMKDITVKKDPGYFVQIYTSSANTTDFKQVKNEHLEEVKNNPYFAKLITDEPDGFVYEKLVDSTTTFGFKYVYIQGDHEFIFQNGMSGIFTLEEANNMYEAVQQKK